MNNAIDNDSCRKLPIVGVLGSGSSAHANQSMVLGQWLATQSVHLLTGGGGGVMQAVSKAFAESEDRVGMVIAVVPGEYDRLAQVYVSSPRYPNPWVEIPIYTHLSSTGVLGTSEWSRNHINVLSSNVIVLLPGKAGTSSEAKLAVHYGKPAVAWLENRDQIEDLHPDIPVVSTIQEVQEFVLGEIRTKNG